jgi:hypothetical protein
MIDENQGHKCFEIFTLADLEQSLFEIRTDSPEEKDRLEMICHKKEVSEESNNMIHFFFVESRSIFHFEFDEKRKRAKPSGQMGDEGYGCSNKLIPPMWNNIMINSVSIYDQEQTGIKLD